MYPSDSVPSFATAENDEKAHVRTMPEPLVIVGMSFRFPQEASSPKGLWHMLMNRQNAMTEWPKDRVNVDAHYHPDVNRPDTINFRGGHFLKDLPSSFDAPFFSTTTAEAESMDPQHRLALETTYHALENAGIPIEKISGSKTSVHVGCSGDDYKTMSGQYRQEMTRFQSTGLTASMVSNRVSWFYNLQGPSVTVDTACSSSMTAFDLACQGLRSGDVDTAIAIGVNLVLGLDTSLSLARLNCLSPDSKCFSFDSRGNGYGRGEGIGVLVLKRLSSALQANDTIRAVVRATGTNQDGRTPGITQPSMTAQEELIRSTYSKAALDLASVGYVEAHGTGTSVGDPIEATAIGNVFRQYHSPSEPLYIGTIKSNIGHLEGASGIAGIIKATLMLEQGIIAPLALFEKPNPGINVEDLKICFPKAAIPWPSTGLRRASVLSFGFGGSNCHVILDDAYHFLQSRQLQGNHCTRLEPSSPESISRDGQMLLNPSILPSTQASNSLNGVNGLNGLNGYLEDCDFPKQLLIFSSADQGGIDRIATTFKNHAAELSHNLAKQAGPKYLRSLAHTLSTRRSFLNWRAFALVDSIDTLQELPQLLSKPIRRSPSANIGLVFTGQGAQYARMGMDLLRFPVFDSSIQRSEMYFRLLGCKWSIYDELAKAADISRVDQPEFSQPLCTALQIALIDLLHSFGVQPAMALGHSSGEIAAAYCVGGLSQESACKVAYFRGICAVMLLHSQSSQSGMMSIGLSEDDFSPFIDAIAARFGSVQVYVACINSPSNITVSGRLAQIDWLHDEFKRLNVFARKLRVSVPYHSPAMQEVADIYLRLLGHLEAGPPTSQTVYMVSSVTGQESSISELSNPQYWIQNLVQPVRFTDALRNACTPKSSHHKSSLQNSRTKINLIVEVGPHGALRGPIRDTLDACGIQDVQYFTAMARSIPSEDSVLQLLGGLFCKGCHLDFSKLTETHSHGTGSVNEQMCLPDLPEYPFDHSRTFWREPRCSKEGYRLREHARLDLLGSPATDWNPLEARWTHVLTPSSQAWVADHKIKGTLLYPAAGMLVMALEGVKQLADKKRDVSSYEIVDTVFVSALSIAQGGKGKEVEFIMRPLQDASRKDVSAWSFRLCSYVEDSEEWQENCNGQVRVHYATTASDAIDGGRESRAYQEKDHQLIEHARDSCYQNLTAQQVYTYFHDRGFDYGPTFQNITDVQYDGYRTALADVASYRWPADGPQDLPQSHLVHPATLDSMMQSSIVCISEGLQKALPAMVPTRLGRLWIRNEGVSYPSLKSTKVYVQADFKSANKASLDFFAIDSTVTGNTALSIADLETTAIALADEASDASAVEPQTCYEKIWKPDITLMGSTQLVQYCESAEVPRAEDSALAHYERLNLIIAKYLFDALHLISQASQKRMPSHLQRYITWARQHQTAFEQGKMRGVTPSDPTWLKITSDPDYFTAFVREAETTIDGKFYVKIGSNLPSILSGAADPLEILFQDGLVEQFYRGISSTAIRYVPVASMVDLMVHKSPALKILEIGAGTGSTTDYILQMLEAREGSAYMNFSQYDFTDISPAFFETAAENYARFGSCMKFFVFDVENDPAAQGIDLGTYDLVVASNVLHVAKNLNRTLHNVRQLLKPGGKLILNEIVTDTMQLPFAFGTLPGWWMGEEENRQLRPWLYASEWHQYLRQTGFSGVDMETPDYNSCHQFSLLVSTAVGDRASVRPISILVGDNAVQQSCAESLVTMLQDSGGATCEVVQVNSLPSKNDLNARHWLSLCDVDVPFFSGVADKTFYAIQRVALTAQSVLWVSSGGGKGLQDPRYHMVNGLFRTASTENPLLTATTLALDSSAIGSQSMAEKIVKVLNNCQRDDLKDEPEYMEDDGLISISRVIAAPLLEDSVVKRKDSERMLKQPFGQGPPLALKVGTPGLLDTLHFIEDGEHSQPLLPGEIEIKVASGGVNFRDCLAVLGQLDATILGGECAGIVSAVGENTSPYKVGDRVVTMFSNSYRTYARGPVERAAVVPDNMSLEDASASILAFSTAWYCLNNVARLAKGESILIHSGAGGTGQAAIQVALYLGAEVYTTVGSEEKKDFLIKTYGLPADRIFYSRNTTFAQGIQRVTNNRGVDVVLNSLSGENLLASWECIALCGRFVEIGKTDIMRRKHLPMWQFRKMCSFASVDLAILLQEAPAMLRSTIDKVMGLLGEQEFFVPQPLKIFGCADIYRAFKLFQSGKNYGKMVIQMRDDEPVDVKLKPTSNFQLDSHRSYVISGGLGGLGQSIALWMARKGAKHLILLSRSGLNSNAAKTFVQTLSAAGVSVKAPQCDVSDKASLAAALAECQKSMPPISGCIQAAMVLRDAVLQNMTFEDWNAVCMPKVQGSWNLHTLLPKGMSFFVCLASLSGIIGNGGQSNYAAGNAYLDEFARYRMAHGERATSIDLGWVDSKGAVAENPTVKAMFSKVGAMSPVSEVTVHALLDYCCDPSSVSPAQIITGLRVPTSDDIATVLQEVPWLSSPTFRRLVQEPEFDRRRGGTNAVSDAADFNALFQSATGAEEAAQVVNQALQHRLSRALGCAPEDVDVTMPLHAAGVDSLLAVELRNYLAKQFGADLAVFEIMSAKSIEFAGALVVKRSLLRKSA